MESLVDINIVVKLVFYGLVTGETLIYVSSCVSLLKISMR